MSFTLKEGLWHDAEKGMLHWKSGDVRSGMVRVSEANLLYDFKQMVFYCFPCLRNERNQTC